jgi:hypothetical protein
VIYGTTEHLNTLQHFGFATFRDFIGNYDCTDIDSVINAGILLSMIWDTPGVIATCEWNRKLLLNMHNSQNIVQNWFLNNL